MIVSCVTLIAQEQNRLRLISSSHSRIDGATGNMMNYRPVYEHNGSTLSADSGYLYTDDLQREYFDAYGHVVITQPDGTIIYANKLNYAADPELAILTNNVRMVDGNSVLTTNYLTYNMKSSTGTYTGGGRIVNETDTITSKNAWYFNRTKDAYFRHDVVVRTPDVYIYTDTMRYNTEAKISYFYGPTNIKGKDGENLYTEDGYYNTQSELAEFYKNNLYTETTRFLKGDTLYYDGKTGNGRAIDNVVFIDTADQFFLQGKYGFYHKDDESILMTGKPLVTMVVKSDSTEADSAAQGTIVPTDSLPTDSLITDSLSDGQKHPEFLDRNHQDGKKVDSVYMTADTLFSQMILLRDYIPKDFKLDRDGGEIEEEEEDFGNDGMDITGEEESEPPTLNVEDESLRSRDSLTLDSIGIDNFDPEALVIDSIAVPDSIGLNSIMEKEKKPVSSYIDTLSIIEKDLTADSLLRTTAIIPTGIETDSLLAGALTALERPQSERDSVLNDSLSTDSTKTRIIKAYRNVRVYKSDLQAVSDSAYYGYPDSMMRFFGSPMAWTQGSQLSGDSLFIQIKNEQIDNMLLTGKAFIVNTGQDSVKFNQIKGKKITGFFTNGELDRVFVDGNAESLAYRENKAKTGYTDMHHNRSSRIKLMFENEELTDFIPIRSTEGTIYPLNLVQQEQEILEGFIWKPSDRPTSKQDLLDRKRVIEQPIIPSTPVDSTATITDSLAIEEDFSIENVAYQVIRPDTLNKDTVTIDTLLKDPLLKDSLHLDTIKRDTIKLDTIPQNIPEALYLSKNSAIFSTARVRWLMAVFSFRSISAKVLSYPSGINNGSYPKPFIPFLSLII